MTDAPAREAPTPASPRAGAVTSPQRAREPELTLRAVVLGLGLSAIMGAANVYLGLKAGLTVSAAIPAAVLGMLALRALGRSSLLEANQIQTAASAGESLAAGIIFTIPALVLIGEWQRFDFWTTTAIALAGGQLGVLLMIPMRRVFIVESPELPYPEGVACAAVLEAGAQRADGSGSADAAAIVKGAALGAAFKLAIGFAGVLRGTLEGAFASGNRVFFAGADVSPALLAVGFIVRLNVSLLLFLGGVLGWLICIPLLPEIEGALRWASAPLPVPQADSAADLAWALWRTRVRYIGVGAMAVGGIASLWHVRSGLRRAVAELRQSLGGAAVSARDELDRDLPPAAIVAAGALCTLAIGGVYLRFTGDPTIAALSTVAMLVLSFFFVAVASYIVGLVGNSNSPVSGMTITAVLATGLVLYACGYAGTQGMVAMLGVAAIVCCATCTAGDTCNDLKTGQLVGSAPYRQQLMQMGGVLVAAFVMAPVLQLLQGAYTIGSRELSAPQAALFASLAQGFFGNEPLPWALIGVGAVLGGAILALDAQLEKRGSAFRAHLMPLAVGIYLPFGVSVPMLIGGVLAHLRERQAAAAGAASIDTALQRGVLLSSGLIAGESLMGVGIALALAAGATPFEPQLPGAGWLTAAVCALALAWFWPATRLATRQPETGENAR